jgi:hypothetical protein
MKNGIYFLQIFSLLVGSFLIVTSVLSMDHSTNDIEVSARLVAGAILFAAGILGLSLKKE